MGHQGSTRRAEAIKAQERLQWAHDRMMEALRRAARDRADRSLTTAAFARAEEYDALLEVSIAASEARRRAAISKARRDASLHRRTGS